MTALVTTPLVTSVYIFFVLGTRQIGIPHSNPWKRNNEFKILDLVKTCILKSTEHNDVIFREDMYNRNETKKAHLIKGIEKSNSKLLLKFKKNIDIARPIADENCKYLLNITFDG